MFSCSLLTVVAASAASLSLAAADSTAPLYVPTRISFQELVNGGRIGSSDNSNDGDDAFWKTLREVGLLSITNVPNLNKQSMLKDLENCLHDSQPPPASAVENNNDDNDNDNDNKIRAPDFALQGSKKENDKDRHRRRTLATHTLAGQPEGMFVATKKNNYDGSSNSDGTSFCSDLRASSRQFRKAVQTTSEAIAARFGSVASAVTIRDQTNALENNVLPVERVINEGEHLEHFHSYYNVGAAAAAATDADVNVDVNVDAAASDTNTIDWHTDQGMMLLFTPGQRRDGTTSKGFFIRLKDGSTVEVDFDSKVDDLVVMLGDGVNQYINDNDSNYNSNTNLRAVPHALTLTGNHNSPRLWYGRMVLPPPNAIHPRSGNNKNGSSASSTSTMMTFGEIRNSMIRGEESALQLGCASSNMVAARDLSEEFDHGGEGTASTNCDEDTSMLCWMRCMDHADYNVSPESCEVQSDNHVLACANDSGELWQTGIHSDAFYLRCLETIDATTTDGVEASNSSSSSNGGAKEESSSSSSSSLVTGSVTPTWMGLFLAMMSGWWIAL